MKKVLFWVTLIFSLLVLNAVPSFAMGFTVSPEMIGGLGDLGYGLIGGAEFDFSGTEYTIENYDNLSEQLKAEAAERKTREFLQAYCVARGIPIPNINPDLPATDLKGFYKSNYFNSANRSVWNNYKLAQDVTEQSAALRFPIGPQAFADWSEYNQFWYEKYRESFSDVDSDPIIIPDEYLSYISLFNDMTPYGFTFVNMPNGWSNQWGDRFTIRSYPAKSYSYFTTNRTGGSNFESFSYTNGLSISNVQAADSILTLYITGSGDNYQGYIDNISDLNIASKGNSKYQYISLYVGSDYSCSILNNSAYGNITNSTLNATCSYSGTLSDVLNYFSLRFKNINVSVNGQFWATAIDNAPANPLIPTFPDVMGGTGEDPYPAYDIVFPNTSDYEGNFDLTSIFDAIKEAIIGASDSDDTTSGTLTRDKVSDTFKDKVGEAVGEATKTMDQVLEDSFPIQDTLNYPAIPPIPDLPINNAFMGTTILAQLIDACQQILPEPLILVFWGIIFILFIIGLIKILHK